MTNATLIKTLKYDVGTNTLDALNAVKKGMVQFILPMSESLKKELLAAQKKIDTKTGVISFAKHRNMLKKKYGI